MDKRVGIMVLLALFILLTTVTFAQDKPINKLSEAIDNIFYGAVECPDNLNETGSKGVKAFDDCTEKTKSGVERSIARVVGGIWQALTFWYPESPGLAESE